MMRDERKCMEDWLNDADRGKPMYLEKNPSQCHLVYHKSRMDLSGIKHVSLRKEAADSSHGKVIKCRAYPHSTHTSKDTKTNVHYVSVTQAITLTSFSMVISRLTNDVCRLSFLVCKSDNWAFRTSRSANQLDVMSCCRDSLE